MRHTLKLLSIVMAGACMFSGKETPAEQSALYQVRDGKVDESTYRGWNVYHQACQQCHGADAQGPSDAPSLMEAVKTLSFDDFEIKVRTSYRIAIDSGAAPGEDLTAAREAFIVKIYRRKRGELIMPAWEMNADVRPYIQDVYAYLTARSDGALGPGKPRRLAKE